MSESRREVRATQAFFEELDRQLGSERGANGEPSSYDFQSHELLVIVERFADDWMRLPELISGRPDYRVLIGSGMPFGHTSLRDNSPQMGQSNSSASKSTLVGTRDGQGGSSAVHADLGEQ